MNTTLKEKFVKLFAENQHRSYEEWLNLLVPRPINGNQERHREYLEFIDLAMCKTTTNGYRKPEYNDNLSDLLTVFVVLVVDEEKNIEISMEDKDDLETE